MKFLFVKALAESHCYSQFANSLHGALLQLGHEASITDQSIHAVDQTVDVNHLARELAATRPDVVLSFSSFFGGAAIDSGESLFDVLGVRFLGWQLDHPIYIHHGLSRPMRRRYSVYSNHNHRRFAEAVKISGRSTCMLPGGEPFNAPIKAYASRQWPVFVAASWNGVPARVWEDAADSPAKRLLATVVDRLVEHPEASLLDAFNDAADHLGLGARLGLNAEFDAEIIKFLRGPLTYLRHLDRINIIRGLVDAGLPVTICGPGWRDYLGDRANVTFLESRVDFKDLPRLYENAKIAINLNAGNGACERAIYSMFSGAAVVSDFNKDLFDGFKAGEEIQFFNRARPAEVADAVGSLLESERGERVAANGHQRAMRSAQWRHRAERLVEFLA